MFFHILPQLLYSKPLNDACNDFCKPLMMYTIFKKPRRRLLMCQNLPVDQPSLVEKYIFADCASKFVQFF